MVASRLPRRLIVPLLRRCYSSYPTKAPPPPPSSAFTDLTSQRRLVLVHGTDAVKYLQGAVASNITALNDPGTGQYTAFLNAKGRLLYDVFVYPANHNEHWQSTVDSPEDPAFFIECDADCVDGVVSHIEEHKLRSKFTMRAIDEGEWTAWAVWPPLPTESHTTAIGCVDERAPSFVSRLILPAHTRPGDVDASAEASGQADVDAYTVRRMLHAVAEGRVEMPVGEALPLESNLDMYHGVDFNKGCYVGQELTVRTRHTGVVRKRILPVQLYHNTDTNNAAQPQGLSYNPDALPHELMPVPQNLSISNTRSRGPERRPAGRLLASVGNVGLALVRLEAMTDVQPAARVAKPDYDHAVDEFWVKYPPSEDAAAADAAANAAGVSTAEWSRIKVRAFIPDWFSLGSQISVLRTPPV